MQGVGVQGVSMQGVGMQGMGVQDVGMLFRNSVGLCPPYPTKR